MEEFKKNLLGRPTKYKEEFCDAIVEYFDITPTDSDGNARDPRFLSAFARSIGVTHETLHVWVEKHDSFFVAYGQAKKLQEQMMVINALQNRYNASFAWRAMMNMFEWRDRSDNQHTGKNGEKLEWNINIVHTNAKSEPDDTSEA